LSKKKWSEKSWENDRYIQICFSVISERLKDHHYHFFLKRLSRVSQCFSTIADGRYANPWDPWVQLPSGYVKIAIENGHS
jgi:hypothetical protein